MWIATNGRPLRNRFSFQPVVAIVRPKTFTMAVPIVACARTARPGNVVRDHAAVTSGDVGERNQRCRTVKGVDFSAASPIA